MPRNRNEAHVQRTQSSFTLSQRRRHEAGAPGTNGTNGTNATIGSIVKVTGSASVASGGVQDVVALCPADHPLPISGGFLIGGSRQVVMVSERWDPSAGPHGSRISMYNPDALSAGSEVFAYWMTG